MLSSKLRKNQEFNLSELEPDEDVKIEVPESGNECWVDDHLISPAALSERYEVKIDLDVPFHSRGLSAEEAARRLQRDGPNAILPKKSTPAPLLFLKEFTDLFSIIVELAGVACFANYAISRELEILFTGLILWFTVILSASLNFVQVRKGISLMKGFANFMAPNSTVFRGGHQITVDTSSIVVGDVLRIKSGDKIPADIRLFYVSGMKVDNSSLTGESEALFRTTDSQERDQLEASNVAFLGSLCVEGEGIGVAIRTGDRTALGRTASLTSSVKQTDTVLQSEIRSFIKKISVVGITLGITVMVVSLVRRYFWLDAVVFAVATIVAIVPQGLQLIVTLTLTLTASRMARNNIMVKKLAIVETLGCTSVICSDKTGTLTQNKMTVSSLVFRRADHPLVGDDSLASESNSDFQVLIRAATLCNRATFDPSDPTGEAVIGDASETALLRYISRVTDVREARRKWPKVAEIPFNSLNKWQLSVHRALDSDVVNLLLMKGAPEKILEKCSTIHDGGEIKHLDDEIRQEIHGMLVELASRGQRVMGFAELELDPSAFTRDYEFDTTSINFPTDHLAFCGLIAMYDPPRENVDQAVAVCQQAGVRVVMVTGDHPFTAKAIAKQLGIITGETPEELIAAESLSIASKSSSTLSTRLIFFPWWSSIQMMTLVTMKR
eukprot:TRINITY_DN5390_c0_g2_i2.p1 TRINITY_DN5390_c0_g2~~TRINITY_DN5390_c0_g2_i2.p1  ORF type:complete len:668 (+),score=109.89 TRINITY_DN5390_c0_g2_i2:214-2217(+)